MVLLAGSQVSKRCPLGYLFVFRSNSRSDLRGKSLPSYARKLLMISVSLVVLAALRLHFVRCTIRSQQRLQLYTERRLKPILETQMMGSDLLFYGINKSLSLKYDLYKT